MSENEFTNKPIEKMPVEILAILEEFNNKEETPEFKNSPFVDSKSKNIDFFLSELHDFYSTSGEYSQAFEFFKQHVEGKDFFDMGCGGKPNEELINFLLDSKAKRYIGIDNVTSKHHSAESKDENSLEVFVLDSDILKFLASIPDEHGGTFLFSGVEEIGSENVEARKYIKNVFEQLDRVMKKDDLAVLSGLCFNMVKRPDDFSQDLNNVINGIKLSGYFKVK